MRILVIVPITGLTGEAIEERLEYLRSLARPGTEVDAVQIEVGPPVIESRVDHVRAGPRPLGLWEEAEGGGGTPRHRWGGGVT